MEEQILEQLEMAEQDLYMALNLGESIIFGYLEVELVDLMEMYYLLRKWQIRLGNKILDSLETLVKQYEIVLEDVNEELLDDYITARQTEDICDIVIEISKKSGLPGICLITPDTMPEA